MSWDGVIDCLGYLSMPLSLVQRPPNAFFSSYIANSCGEVMIVKHDRHVVKVYIGARALEAVFL